MGADGADEKALKGFTDRNATTFMGRPSMYIDRQGRESAQVRPFEVVVGSW